jgi:hypothetical protein
VNRLTVIRVTLLAALALAAATLGPAPALATTACTPGTETIDPAVQDTTSIASPYKPTFTVTLTSSSPTASVEWMLDTGGCISDAAGTPISFSSLSEGLHTLSHRAVDGLKASAWVNSPITVDGTNPRDDTQFPSSAWTGVAPSISVTGSDPGGSGVASVQWKLDTTTYPTRPNPSGLTMPEGTHKIATRIFDNAGNDSGWSPDHTVNVDLTDPVDTTFVPTGWQTSQVKVKVTGDDGAGSGINRVEWQVDGSLNNGTPASPTSGGSGSQVTISSEGTHKLWTRVVDDVGHATAWRFQVIQIDTVVPDDVTPPTVAGWLTAAPVVDITGTDATSGVQKVQWQLDTGPIEESPTNPYSYTMDKEGVHTLNIRVIDNAGLSSGWKARTIKLDRTAPNNTTDHASSAWQSSGYTVALTGDDSGSGISEMRWMVDNTTVHSGPPGTTQVVVSGTGPHKLTTWAVDVAGNWSAQRIEAINIDALAPDDTTETLDPRVPNHKPVAVSGDDSPSGVHHVEWQLDNNPVQKGPAPSTVQIDGAGSHTLKTRVVDNAGNDSGWRTQTTIVDLSLSPDTTLPIDTSDAVDPGWSASPVTLTVSAVDYDSGIQAVEWRMDGMPVQSDSSGHATVQVKGDGDHRLETRGRDKAGNRSAWRSQHIKIDGTVPNDTTALSDWTNAKTFKLSGSDATSGVARIEYEIDGVQSGTVLNDGMTPALSDGPHTITHRVIDNAENASAEKTDTVNVDTVKPVVNPVAIPSSSTGWLNTKLSVTLTGSDDRSGVDHFEWRVDGGTIQKGITPVVPDGMHTLAVQAVDAAGNQSGWQSYPVNIDVTPPTNTTPTPPAPWQRNSYTVTIGGTDSASGVKQVEWKVDGGGVSTTPNVTIGGKGLHKLESRIIDKADNASTWRTDMIGIDPDAPTLSVDCGTSEWRASPATCSVAADNGPAGRKALTVARNGVAQDVGADGVYRVDDDGEWLLTIEAMDGADNYGVTHALVRVDRTKPTVSVNCRPDSGTAYVCTASAADAGSGVAGLSYSVDGGRAQPIAVGAAFTVAKGTLVVSASDRAGNATSAAPLKLANRVPPAPPAPNTTPNARSRTGTVVLVHGGSVQSRMVGELALASMPTATNVDVRPLTLGKGRFRLELVVKAGKDSKTVRKTVTTRAYTPRLQTGLGGAGRVSAKLTVLRSSHGRWISHARGSATLG